MTQIILNHSRLKIQSQNDLLEMLDKCIYLLLILVLKTLLFLTDKTDISCVGGSKGFSIEFLKQSRNKGETLESTTIIEKLIKTYGGYLHCKQTR